jgi:hypothetical protein
MFFYFAPKLELPYAISQHKQKNIGNKKARGDASIDASPRFI